MPERITVVDAFADRPFAGNPAAVCVRDAPAPEGWMRDVAREMNLSETAFLVPLAEPGSFPRGCFTPVVEVALCGHAPLASPHALGEGGFPPADRALRFSTRSGWLTASRRGEEI